MARIQIRQGDLTNALEDHSYEYSWVLDLSNGEIILVPVSFSFHDEGEWEELDLQMEAEPERFRSIEPLPSHVGFNIMAAFAEDLPDSHLKDRLFRALNSRHPFRYFKDTLCENDKVRKTFFAYRDEQLLYHAQQWLEEEDIDAELIPYETMEEYHA